MGAACVKCPCHSYDEVQDDDTAGSTSAEAATPASSPHRSNPLELTWRQELEGEWEPQYAMVREVQSRVAGRPRVTLTQEAVNLEDSAFAFDDPETLAMAGAVWTFVRDLCKAVGDADPLFAGPRVTVHLVGSHGDGTRVSAKADEFDVIVLVIWEGVRLWREGAEWHVSVSGRALAVWRGEDGGNDVLRCQIHSEDGGGEEWEVDPQAFLGRWREGVDLQTPTTPLPEGLTHGGLLSPLYTRVTASNRTTVTLSLVWRGETPLTSDLTPAIPVPREALQDVTREKMYRLETVAGLEQSTHPALLVPGQEDSPEGLRPVWFLTTCLLETLALTALGRSRSPVVSLIRGLKLITRRYLQWRPQGENDVEEGLAVLATLMDWKKEAEGCIGGVVGVDGLSHYVLGSISTGELLVPPDEDEAAGKVGTGLGVHICREALVVAATHRAHHRMAPPGGVALQEDDDLGAQVCEPGCGLCKDLTQAARGVIFSLPFLHPAVKEVIGVTASPQLAITSAFLKYLVLGDMLEGRLGGQIASEGPAGETGWVPDPGDDGVGHYMGRLSAHLEVGWEGEGLPHPLLSGEGIPAIMPRVVEGVRMFTKSPDERKAKERRMFPVWDLTPESLVQCHSEVCRQLCDVSRGVGAT